MNYHGISHDIFMIYVKTAKWLELGREATHGLLYIIII